MPLPNTDYRSSEYTTSSDTESQPLREEDLVVFIRKTRDAERKHAEKRARVEHRRGTVGVYQAAEDGTGSPHEGELYGKDPGYV